MTLREPIAFVLWRFFFVLLLALAVGFSFFFFLFSLNFIYILEGLWLLFWGFYFYGFLFVDCFLVLRFLDSLFLWFFWRFVLAFFFSSFSELLTPLQSRMGVLGKVVSAAKEV